MMKIFFLHENRKENGSINKKQRERGKAENEGKKILRN